MSCTNVLYRGIYVPMMVGKTFLSSAFVTLPALTVSFSPANTIYSGPLLCITSLWLMEHEAIQYLLATRDTYLRFYLSQKNKLHHV